MQSSAVLGQKEALSVPTSGMVGRANTFEGVRLRTIGNIVGGKAPAARNILAGNGRASVRDEAR